MNDPTFLHGGGNYWFGEEKDPDVEPISRMVVGKPNGNHILHLSGNLGQLASATFTPAELRDLIETCEKILEGTI